MHCASLPAKEHPGYFPAGLSVTQVAPDLTEQQCRQQRDRNMHTSPTHTSSPVPVIIKLVIKVIRVATAASTPPAPAHAVRQRPALLRDCSRRLGRRRTAAVAKVLLLLRRRLPAATTRQAAAARRLPLCLLPARLCCTLIV